MLARAAARVAMLAGATQAMAQSDDADPEMRIQQLENQLRRLTGQNEELQYRNRQLEDRLKLLQDSAPAPNSQAAIAPPRKAAVLPPVDASPPYRQPQPQQPAYESQIAA